MDQVNKGDIVRIDIVKLGESYDIFTTCPYARVSYAWYPEDEPVPCECGCGWIDEDEDKDIGVVLIGKAFRLHGERLTLRGYTSTVSLCDDSLGIMTELIERDGEPV